MASVGVSAPGHEIFLLALVRGYYFRMQAGADDELRAGIDGGLGLIGGGDGAGAEQKSFGCTAFRSSLSRSIAPGTVMVTSTMVMPPAIMASTTARPWATLLARRTGMRPTRSMICWWFRTLEVPQEAELVKLASQQVSEFAS